MEGEKIKVKWDKIWYPAIILRRINEEEVEVEFDDPDFDHEIVQISDTKALIVSSNSPPTGTKSIAGAFNWQLFKVFFKDIMGDSIFVAPLSVKELSDLDLRSSLFSTHARERTEERYHQNMQELLRSLNTNQYLAFHETRQKVFCDGLIFDCTPDLNRIISLRSDGSTREKKRHTLEFEDIEKLRNAVEKWNHSHSLKISIDFETCKLSTIQVITTQVITTTTRFILSENCSCIVTVINNSKSFSEWRKYYERDQKHNEWKKHGKDLKDCPKNVLFNAERSTRAPKTAGRLKNDLMSGYKSDDL